MRRAVMFLLCLVPATLLAQGLTIGQTIPAPQGRDTAKGLHTVVDLSYPASATGSVYQVAVGWTQALCTSPAQFKIHFYSRHGNTLAPIAERGPYTVTDLFHRYPIDPPVTVRQGDLVGLTPLTSCGGLALQPEVFADGYLTFPGDLSSAVELSAGIRDFAELDLQAEGTPVEVVRAVLPVVGTTAGAHGSNFKTTLQASNFLAAITPSTAWMMGRFVFHPAGVEGSSSDPSVPFAIAPGATVVIDDVVAATGLTGIGSLDVVVAAGGVPPLATARVYDDKGTGGTSGFMLPSLWTWDESVISIGMNAFLATPTDLSRFRMNIGIRTLFSGASLRFTLRNAQGAIVRMFDREFVPNYFEQQSASAFLGIEIEANELLQIASDSGGAIVYASTIDNTTNDPSLQVARPIFGDRGHVDASVPAQPARGEP